jgi:hypothetical protein
VLAGVDEDLLVLFSEFPGDGCALDELRAGADDGRIFMLERWKGEEMRVCEGGG